MTNCVVREFVPHLQANSSQLSFLQRPLSGLEATRNGSLGHEARSLRTADYRSTSPSRLPKVFENVPPRDLNFTGREEHLAAIHALHINSQAIKHVAIHGLGGIGKTSLAIEYAYRPKVSIKLPRFPL
jgi:hypothetical protein